MRVGFAFFRAEHGGLFSRGITWRTGGPYSHVEFYLPGEFVVEEGSGTKRHLCFSSYESDSGVRWKHINIKGGWWDCVEFEVENPRPSIDWANRQVGKQYDWAGILGFVNPWRKGGDPNRWFCSEICYVLAQKLTILPEGGKAPDKVSPYDLWKMFLATDGSNRQGSPSAPSPAP